MFASPTSSSTNTADLQRQGWRSVSLLLWGGFGLVVAGLISSIWFQSAFLYLLVPMLLGAAGIAWLVPRPVAHLSLVLLGHICLLGDAEGLQMTEVLYGAYLAAYLCAWYSRRASLGLSWFIRTREDLLIALFMVWGALSGIWSVLLYGSRPSVVLGEAVVLSMLAFYFPVRDTLRKHPRFGPIVIGIFLAQTLFVVGRNVLMYRRALDSAEAAWQIVNGRVAMNELFVMVTALAALVYVLNSPTWRARIVAGAVFIVSVAGLILTQSRGYWAAFLVGVLLLFLLTDLRRKVLLGSVAAVGLAGITVLALLIAPEEALIVASGMAERFTSLGTAVTSDISLISRFVEASYVWTYIETNPIIGYGIGTEYSRFDIITDVNIVSFFVHNGYIGLWFKYGLVGLGLMMMYLASVGFKAFKLARASEISAFGQIVGVIVLIVFAAEAVVANTSTPFQMAEGLYLFALAGGLVVTMRERERTQVPWENRA